MLPCLAFLEKAARYFGIYHGSAAWASHYSTLDRTATRIEANLPCFIPITHNFKGHTALYNAWIKCNLIFLHQPELMHQRNSDTTRWVLARNGARSKVAHRD